MKNIFLALGFFAALALGSPAAADAHVSLAFALPGFGLFVHAPCAPPVAYAPPPVYYAPPAYYYRPRAYYAPVPAGFRHRFRRGHHFGWRHGRDWDD